MATIYTNISSNKWKTTFLITFFVAFIIGLGYVFSRGLNLQWLFPLAIIIALVQGISSYWWSDRLVLAISNAKEIAKPDAPELYRIVENLSIAGGLPMPRVYIIEDSAPNAFATGRDPEHAVICVTRGLLEKLNKPELEGVIAHEFSHIGNYDIRLSTVIVVLVGIVVLLSDWFFRIRFWGGGDDDSGDNQAKAVFMIIGIILALLAPIFATLIQLAVSRKRELLADADGALLTRNPNALADALAKITADTEPLEEANKATAHLYIANPLNDHQNGARSWFAGLFDTHPDPELRIKLLREMGR
jgi:heat shock protein HtpX